jgi:hypothetical protein
LLIHLFRLLVLALTSKYQAKQHQAIYREKILVAQYFSSSDVRRACSGGIILCLNEGELAADFRTLGGLLQKQT